MASEQEKQPDFTKKEGLMGGFLHLFAATSYSLQGLATGCRLSLAFRQELMVFVLLIGLLFYFEKSLVAWIVSLGLWLIVLALELVNSAIEECLDLITKEYSPSVKAGKDMGSAAVFLFIALNLVAQPLILWKL